MDALLRAQLTRVSAIWKRPGTYGTSSDDFGQSYRNVCARDSAQATAES